MECILATRFKVRFCDVPAPESRLCCTRMDVGVVLGENSVDGELLDRVKPPRFLAVPLIAGVVGVNFRATDCTKVGNTAANTPSYESELEVDVGVECASVCLWEEEDEDVEADNGEVMKGFEFSDDEDERILERLGAVTCDP